MQSIRMTQGKRTERARERISLNLRDFQRLGLVAANGGGSVSLTDSGKRLVQALITFTDRPHWIADPGELVWKGELAKTVRGDAVNQRLVLSEFEADGWPPRIENPLRRISRGKHKVRLRETVRGLNENLRFIRFHSDRHGGITWDVVA